MSNQESKSCVFYGEDTRKKRKQNICDTYEEHKIPSSLRKIYNKNISLRKEPHQTSVLCSVCKTPACYLCVKAICNLMKLNHLHDRDKWYEQMTEWFYNNIYPKKDFVAHYCELMKKIYKM